MLIGDALFNMRSGLDHIAWRLSKPTTAQESYVEFPIFGPGRAADYAKAIIRKLPSANAEALREVETVQPFNGKHPDWHPLWRLYLLSNGDRHRLLHLTGATAQLAELHYTDVRDMTLTLAEVNPVGAFEDGAVLARVHTVPTGPHPSMEIKLRTLWAVAFAPDTPAPNMIVSVLMWGMRDYVRDTVVAHLKPFII